MPSHTPPGSSRNTVIRAEGEVAASTISDDAGGRILESLGYSLQAPAKEKEGASHPDRDARFSYLNDTAGAFVSDGQPVISVDTSGFGTGS